MSKRNNLKPILIILGGLVAILALIQFMDKKSERSFKEYVVKVDTAKMNCIEITPKGEKKPVELVKEGDLWMVSLDNKKVQADKANVAEIAKLITALKAEKVVSTSKEKWAELQVNDTTGPRVTIKDGKKVLADFYSGKFSYDRNTREMASYVRNVKENETYAVEGYMSMMFNRGKETFRESSLINGDPQSWTKLTFNYPADSSFVLEKTNNRWKINGMPADSAKVQSYFSKIRMLNSTNYDDAAEIANGQVPLYSVQVDAENTRPIEIKGYIIDGVMVYTSSMSIGNIYKDDKIAPALLVSSRSLLP